MSTTYDAARSQVVLFGGYDGARLNDTWIWDGTTWAQQHAITSPSGRIGMGMTSDAGASEVVLFSGYGDGGYLGDTWTWDGSAWARTVATQLKVSPRSGPPQTAVTTTGSGFNPYEDVTITFIDSVNGETVLRTFVADGAGHFKRKVSIPFSATAGVQKMVATGTTSLQKAKAKFTVT